MKIGDKVRELDRRMKTVEGNVRRQLDMIERLIELIERK